MPNIYWRLARTSPTNSTPGPVQTVTLDEKPNGNWGAVNSIPSNTDIQISTTSSTGPWISKRTKPTKVVENSINFVHTSPGGRPNWVPIDYYKSVRNQILDPLTHPMPFGITHNQIKSGRWSDPTTWLGNTVPGNGAVWWGANGMTLIYDVESDVITRYGGGPIHWVFTTDKTKDTRMRIGTFMNMGITDIQDNTLSTTPGKAKFECIIHPVEVPGASALIGFMPMGPTRMDGAQIEANLWLGVLSGQTEAGAPAGSTIIHVPGGVAAGWAVNHEIWIGATEYRLPSTTDPDYTGPTTYYGYTGERDGMVQTNMNEFQFSDNEMVTITEVLSGDRFRINKPLAYNHMGLTRTRPYSGEVARLRPRVVNTFKSIVFRSASAEEDAAIDPNANIRDRQKRGHFMPMFCSDMAFRGVRFKNFGRSDTDPTFSVPAPKPPYRVDMAGGAPTVHPILSSAGGTPLEDPTNVTGRWAMHLHECGGPYNASEYVLVENCVVDAPEWAPPLPGWAMAVHSSRASIERCAFINGRGAGLVTEVGNEIGQAVGCVSMGMRGDGERLMYGSRGEVYTKHNDHAGVGYGMQSRAFILRDCDSIGCKYAASWHAQKTIREKRMLRAIDLRLAPSAYRGDWRPDIIHFPEEHYIVPASVQLPPMHGVNGWACRFGISVIHRGGDVRKWDNQPGLFEKCDMINVPFSTEIPQYSSDYMFMDCIFIGPLNMMSSSKMARLGNVSWGFSFTGNHIENFEYAITDSGAGLNFKGIIAGNVLVNVTHWANFPYRTVRGDHASRNSHGPWTKHPDDAAIPDTTAARWNIRDYKNEPFSALPLGYPLGFYGVPMPAGAPVVPRGGTPVFYPHADMNLNLSAGAGRNRATIRGTWVDCAGPVNWPEWNSSESFPQQLSKRTTVSLGKLHPEQLVLENGCWNDNGTWKVRVPLPYADRVSHVRAVYNLDFTLNSTFDSAFLAANDLGGPPPQWKWPDELEMVKFRPLAPEVKTLKFLSPTSIKVVDGQTFSHPIIYNTDNATVTIVPGVGNASSFEVVNMGRTLRFASNGTRSVGTYNVTLRAVDVWGNTVQTPHTITVVPANRVSSEIQIDRTPGPMNPQYEMLIGGDDTFSVSDNGRISVNGTTSGRIIDLGSVGTHDMQLIASISTWAAHTIILRMEDATNFIQVQRNDSSNAFIVHMCVNGVFSELGRYTNVAGGQFGVRLYGDRMVHSSNPEMTLFESVAKYPINQATSLVKVAPQDELYMPGAVILPPNAPKGTRVGLRTTNTATNEWLNQFIVRPI